jgi:hypothetical protein
MSRLLGAALAASLATFALALPAQADAINNLSIIALPAGNIVPQSQSNPCIICGTEAAHQPGTFGYNNFSNHGNDTSFATFSTNIIGGGPLLGDLQSNALTYSGSLLESLLSAGFTFGVAIDINTAKGEETLQSFQLIDLSKNAGERVIFDFTGPYALPDINNGNGKGDYLLTGFNLLAAGVQPGDALLFRAVWTGASDGAESFYIVPTGLAAVPVPGAVWLFGSGIAGLGMLKLRRRKARAATA